MKTIEKQIRNEQVLNDQVVVNAYGNYTETVEYVGCVKKNGHEDGMFQTFAEFAELDNEKWGNLKHSELVEEYHNTMKKLYENCDIKRINVCVGNVSQIENCDKDANYRIVLRAKFKCDGINKVIVGLEWGRFLK